MIKTAKQSKASANPHSPAFVKIFKRKRTYIKGEKRSFNLIFRSIWNKRFDICSTTYGAPRHALHHADLKKKKEILK